MIAGIKDLSTYVCAPSTRLLEVVQRLDRAEHLFQMVLDEDRRLLGTITDGDIRRAMLNGIGLDSEARDFMQSEPRTGLLGELDANASKLKALGSTRRFLPIVDSAGKLVEVLLHVEQDATVARALVMAGGYGRRLGNRTLNTPKPLLEVGGRPILDRVLTALEDAGVRHITLSIHYLGDQVRGFVAQRDNRAEMHFLAESEPLGTAGAIGHLDDHGRGPLLVVNGDVLTKCNFGALHEFHLRHGLDGTIGVTQHDVDVPYGVIRYDADGLFAGIDEKPRISNFVAAGVYYLAPQFAGLVGRGRHLDMPELLNRGRDIGLKIGLFPIHEYWTDVGHPEDLEAADRVHSDG